MLNFFDIIKTVYKKALQQILCEGLLCLCILKITNLRIQILLDQLEKQLVLF